DFVGGSREYGRQPPVIVLGPHFSGSQVSLERALRAWAGRKACEGPSPCFRIVSGSATSVERPRLEAACGPHGTVRFRATVHPEVEVIATTLAYLGVAAGRPGESLEFTQRLAILCESNTTFGRHVSTGVKRAARPGPQPTWFPFPLHVSDVRSAYEQTADP